MANRYPLILDTTDGNKIKELPAGDNVTLRENSILDVQNINALGVINAPVITVNGNKIVAQNFADLTDTPNTFVGSENYFIKVNATGTGIEFRPLGDIANISVNNLTTTGNILPEVTGNNNIGSIALKYNQITALAVSANLVSYSGSVVFDATTGRVSYSALQGAPTFLSEFTDDIGFLRTADLDTTIAGLFDEGEVFNTDIRGSVFGEDSTLLVDGVSSIITGDVSNSQITTNNLNSTSATITNTTTTSINGPATGNLTIDAGSSGIIDIGTNSSTTTVNIEHAVIDSFDQGSGLGVARLTASTDLIISAGNRVKVEGAVPFRLAHLSAAEILLVVALEGDVIYNTTTNRLQMYQGSAWKDVNGNVEATAGTSNFNDVVVAGDLTIQGTTTNVETTNTNITDNVITLNKGELGAGVTLGTSGIDVERGTEANKTFVWDEAADKWTLGTETLVAATFEGNVTGNITGDTQGTHTGDVVGDVTGNAAGNHTGTFDGEVTGSVFGDDSTVLVDGNNNKIVGPVETHNLRTTNPTIALGYLAGQTDQGNTTVAIGSQAGNNAQNAGAVGIGYKAGNASQGLGAIALGYQSGQNTQGIHAIAIGELAGQATQGGYGIAIGYQSGQTTQGADGIAIGRQAGFTNQAANSIVLNATGSAVENTTASSLVIKPIRNAASAHVMMYDTTSGEVTQTATPGTLAADLDQATIAIGATTATAINIGNAGSTTTINGTVSLPAVVAGSITADDSMSITTAAGDGNAISIGPGGTNTFINLTADDIRFFGPVTSGITGDVKGSVTGDDSTILVDAVNNKIVGDIESTNINGTTVRVDTIENNATDNLTINVAGFLNIYGGADDAGVSNIQMDKNGINHIEISTEPGNPSDPTDFARIAINAAASEGDVRIGTPTSTRNQVVEIYNAEVTGSLIGNAFGSHSGTFAGDMNGSVYGDDSILLVDGVQSKIVGPISKIVGDVQQISGPSEISLDTLITEITTTGTDAYTLADGVIGQVKIILAADVSGGTGTVTPTTVSGGTTLTFDAVGESITLVYTSVGWMRTAGAAGVLA